MTIIKLHIKEMKKGKEPSIRSNLEPKSHQNGDCPQLEPVAKQRELVNLTSECLPTNSLLFVTNEHMPGDWGKLKRHKSHTSG